MPLRRPVATTTAVPPAAPAGAGDAWRVPATGEGWRHRFTVPYAGWALSALQSALGRLALMVVGALAALARVLRWLWRPGSGD